MSCRTARSVLALLVAVIGSASASAGVPDPTWDSDGDGLLDIDEIVLNTDPLDPDTDDGGVGDGDEVLADGTDPLASCDDAIGGVPQVCDEDQDGVQDDVDLCPLTAPGDPVGPDGCSIEQSCPCDFGWWSHGAYVVCVAHAAHDLWIAGLITTQQKGQTVLAAAWSECGED